MVPTRRAWFAAASAVATAALLPFARPLWAGESLYFRDLGLIFFPLRKLALEGLGRGFVSWWNPFVHEGAALPIPAIGYPLDLLQLLAPTEAGLSVSLVLHLPLAAVAFLALARSLGLTPVGAVAGALVYALGGFALSTVSLYIYVQALAWAPLTILALGRAASRGRGRDVALAAAACAMIASTTGAELALQAMALGLALGLPVGGQPGCWAESATTRPAVARALLRCAAALALAAALVAPLLVAFRAQLEGSERGGGFATPVVLAHSIHPLSWLQALVAGFYGDPYDLANRFWGQRFFTRGFPYFVSLYVGPLALGLAAGGLLWRAADEPPARRALRWRLGLVMPLAACVALGSYAGLSAVVELVPALRAFRYPQKVYFTLHVAVALLAALGTDAVARRARRPLLAALGLGAALCATPLLPVVLPAASAWFARGFFPAALGAEGIASALRFMLTDAVHGGAIAVAGAGLAPLLRSSPRAALAPALLAALLAADLLRASAGLNATVTPDYFRLSPEIQALAAEVRAGGRLFTCDVVGSATYTAFRRAHRGRHEMATFTLLRESLTPNYNVDARVPTALSLDLTMMVPGSRVASPELARCDDLPALLPRLRAAGVSHVVSLDPLAHEALAAAPPRPLRALPGLALSVYRLQPAPPPLVEVEGGRLLALAERPGWVAAQVEAGPAARLVVRQAWASGWTAQVDGAPAAVEVFASRHLAVPLPAGSHEVRLAYSPPGLGLAGLVAAIALVATAALGLGRARQAAAG